MTCIEHSHNSRGQIHWFEKASASTFEIDSRTQCQMQHCQRTVFAMRQHHPAMLQMLKIADGESGMRHALPVDK
jgi:hypothetical protein